MFQPQPSLSYERGVSALSSKSFREIGRNTDGAQATTAELAKLLGEIDVVGSLFGRLVWRMAGTASGLNN